MNAAFPNSPMLSTKNSITETIAIAELIAE